MSERAPVGLGGEEGREALPPFPFRHRVIPALHEVVPVRFGVNEPGLSLFYAGVAALSVNAALGLRERPYFVQAGRVHVRVGGVGESELSPAANDGHGLSFHAWAGRRHPSGRLEVVDLSTRHFGEWAAGSGRRLDVRFPRAVWAWADDVPRAFRYLPDEETTANLLPEFWSAHENAMADAARAVLVRIEGDGG